MSELHDDHTGSVRMKWQMATHTQDDASRRGSRDVGPNRSAAMAEEAFVKACWREVDELAQVRLNTPPSELLCCSMCGVDGVM